MSQNDGDSSSYDKERQRLLDEFAQALKTRHTNPGSEPWFSEDDLVDLFDYAGDVGNDYLRAEALMWGARIYPDSERLFERRGVFYSDVLSDQDVAAFTSTNSGTVTFLTSLLDLRARNLGQEGTLEELKFLINSYEGLDDEDAIQFVNLAADTGNIDWLMENLDMLRGKVQYEPVLLYEIGAESVEHGKPEYGEKTFSMLVEQEPYNADFWSGLCQTQFELGKFANAEESVDMALAINPSCIDAVQLKAQILSMQFVPDPLAELKELNLKFPDNAIVAQCYLKKLTTKVNDAQARQEIVSEIERLLQKFPNDPAVVTAYVAVTPFELTVSFLNQQWKDWGSDEGIQHWRDWTEYLLAGGMLNGALAVVRCILRNSRLSADELVSEYEAQVVISMMLQRWEDTEQAAAAFNAHSSQGLSPVVAIALIYAQMHMLQYSEAKNTFKILEHSLKYETMINRPVSHLQFLNVIFRQGVLSFIEKFEQYFTRKPDEAVKFDPFDLFGFE